MSLLSRSRPQCLVNKNREQIRFSVFAMPGIEMDYRDKIIDLLTKARSDLWTQFLNIKLHKISSCSVGVTKTSASSAI